MSQSGNKGKKKKQNQQKKKSLHNLLWVLAGCIILGGGLGFLAGKYWLYPSYHAEEMYAKDTAGQSQSDIQSQELENLNRQIQNEDSAPSEGPMEE